MLENISKIGKHINTKKSDHNVHINIYMHTLTNIPSQFILSMLNHQLTFKIPMGDGLR